MSRSYREPWVTDGNTHKGYGYKKRGRRKQYKRFHNRIIRRIRGVPNGAAHKRMGIDPWTICDYKFNNNCNINTGSHSGIGVHSYITEEDYIKWDKEARRK